MPQPAKSTASTGLLEAYKTARTARAMSDLYEEHARLTAKYVHACSRGHEVIQIAAGRFLQPQDYVSCYYRDDSLLLSMGMTPEELMLQLFAKKDDPFSGGRTYYSHPSLNRPGQPKIPHQSSATGMQAIPAAGCAMGLQYLGQMDLESHAVRDGKAAGVKAVDASLEGHFTVQHWRRRDDRGRSGRSVSHDGAAATAHGLAGAGQRMGHQRPQLGGTLRRRHHVCQGLPRH